LARLVDGTVRYDESDPATVLLTILKARRQAAAQFVRAVGGDNPDCADRSVYFDSRVDGCA
jgi:hypothetical protein